MTAYLYRYLFDGHEIHEQKNKGLTRNLSVFFRGQKYFPSQVEPVSVYPVISLFEHAD